MRGGQRQQCRVAAGISSQNYLENYNSFRETMQRNILQQHIFLHRQIMCVVLKPRLIECGLFCYSCVALTCLCLMCHIEYQQIIVSDETSVRVLEQGATYILRLTQLLCFC